MERRILHDAFVAAKSLRSASSPRVTCAITRTQTPYQQQRFRNTNSHDDQVYPLTGYWADLLESKKDILEIPKEKIQPATRTIPEPLPADSLPKTDKEEREERARIVFGSRLTSPQDRRTELEKASQNVAGVMVPPKPDEPDNCCMSGCVNCVWDVYRDELEEWASKSAEARGKLQAQRASGDATGTMTKEPGMPTHVASSMDDDGGGSETNWEQGLATSGGKEDLFKNVPVGIREFMRTEKLLKQKHAQDGSIGG